MLISKMEDFFIKGYLLIDGRDLICAGDYDKLEYLSARKADLVDAVFVNQEAKDSLAKLQSILIQNYLQLIFPNITPLSSAIWEGVDTGSEIWHNDSYGRSTMNSNILCYLDDMHESTGGKLWVRGPAGVESVLPKRGLIVWLNQSKIFEHRADTAKIQRRVLGFDFYIPALDKLS